MFDHHCPFFWLRIWSAPPNDQDSQTYGRGPEGCEPSRPRCSEGRCRTRGFPTTVVDHVGVPLVQLIIFIESFCSILLVVLMLTRLQYFNMFSSNVIMKLSYFVSGKKRNMKLLHGEGSSTDSSFLIFLERERQGYGGGSMGLNPWRDQPIGLQGTLSHCLGLDVWYSSPLSTAPPTNEIIDSFPFQSQNHVRFIPYEDDLRIRK